ncbi:hypothetical protein CkaCkLH20_07667 [Colletotrichum karsti]|uniref:HNH nuclease domain-containing protein n=1 Tax=Colletotrichum karsti TaxID=1095194 RepID=A0A9P6I0D3_9PEZI|nr:uncharacterized protein CkaCkLH20_07667 [Colletotrichum karsti]KAF9874973.1 hypothetical protein CkaCkLH20_07667 [Colletotrichum karsti]
MRPHTSADDVFSQKIELIKEIRKLCDGPPEYMYADLWQGVFWSMLWTQDAGFLKDIIRRLENPATRFDLMERELMTAVDGFPKLLRICTADPRICHIFPFAAKKHYESVRTQLRAIKLFLGPQVFRSLVHKLGIPNNEIDSLANVLSLNAQLHKYWVDGRFALEPLGAPTLEELPEDHPDYENEEDPEKDETRASKRQKRRPQKRWYLKLRFEWMRQTDLANAQEEMDFDTDPRKHWKETGNVCYDHYNVKTARPIENGHIVEIFANESLAKVFGRT